MKFATKFTDNNEISESTETLSCTIDRLERVLELLQHQNRSNQVVSRVTKFEFSYTTHRADFDLTTTVKAEMVN